MSYQPYRGRLLGQRLRALRGNLTMEYVAQHVTGFSFSKISRIENAVSLVKPGDLERLLNFYANNGVPVTEQDRENLRLLTGRPRPGWWSAFHDILPVEQLDLIEVEATAEQAATWSLITLPTQLQTPAVARELISARESGAGRAAALGQVHMSRQAVLLSGAPLRLRAVVAEPALRALGHLRHEQVGHLLHMADLPTITIQFIPTDRIPAGGRLGDFTLLYAFGSTLVSTQPPLGEPVIGDGTPYLALVEDLSAAALPPDESVQRIAALGA